MDFKFKSMKNNQEIFLVDGIYPELSHFVKVHVIHVSC